MRDEDNEDAPVIEFVNVTSAAASSRFCVSTLQAVGVGAVGADGEAERFDDVEHTQPAGLFAVPTTSANTEAVVIRRGDEAVALVVVDKSKPAQNVESGETRLYGVGGSNGTAVIRIRADGSIEITAKVGVNISLNVDGAGDVVLDGGSLKVARATDPVTPHANMTAWMTAVAGFINGLAPGTVPPLPVSFAIISAATGASHVKA